VVYAARPSHIGDLRNAKNCTGVCQRGDDSSIMHRVKHLKEQEWGACIAAGECPKKTQSLPKTLCVNGWAGEYECLNVDLLTYVNLPSLGTTGNGNDIWGWTDPVTNQEIAIAGTATGTSFVDVTNPENPSVLGFLDSTNQVSSSWRDIKVYRDHAFIVSEANAHGMQIFDLTTLRTMERSPIHSQVVAREVPKLEVTAFYGEFGSAHNLAINEDTGFAYSVGSRTCSAGLHIVDIRDPVKPQFVGCFGNDGYVHDTQCVIYKGPDTRYSGKEICFGFNEDSLTIVDVTDKSAMVILSRTDYSGRQYTHQGWLLPEQGFLLLNDELDEIYGTNKHTRTMLWDVRNLQSTRIATSFYSSKTVVDHNLYTLGDEVYCANYCGGLRILNTQAAKLGGNLNEIGFFDVAPDCDSTTFLGSWSTYPYFKSGTIVVQSIDRGLFIVKFNKPAL